MIEIEIDGKTVQAPQGAMIIEVADANDIRIPRFCYHKKLSVAANCRMCLVEVEKVGKTVPACATPVTPGMKVFTHSQKALDSQRAVMEFLLINHPLDCPICDQGGECELQDNALGYGLDHSPYEETKRVVKDEDIGPLVATDLTRCIQCTRCVRFGHEVAGMRELGMTQRGEHSEIRTFVKNSLASEVSANIIDLCPVGALTSKPFRFSARAWELNQHDSIAPHDALGSNIHLHTRRDELMRVVPKENENINEVWLSDRDRYSYLGVNSEDRLLSPMIKRDGQWHATDWESALNFAVTGIQEAKQNLLALSTPSATQEEYYLLAKLWQALGSNDCTFYLRNSDLSDGLTSPHFGISIAEIEQQKTILILGSELTKEIPLLSLRLRKAALAGANIHAINPCEFTFNFNLNSSTVALPHQWANELAAILKHLLTSANDHALQSLLQSRLIQAAVVTEQHQRLADQLKQADKSFIYLGALAYHSPQAGLLRLLTQAIAEVSNSQWGMHTDGANTMGLSQVQQLCGMPSKSLNDFTVTPQAILLHNVDPAFDCANPQRMNEFLQQAKFVVALTPFKSAQLLQNAHVLLPIATLGETSGTFVNLMSEAQSFKGCLPPKAEARPAWKVFRVLANMLGFADFTYTSTQDVLLEIQNASPDAAKRNPRNIELNLAITDSASLHPGYNEFHSITQWPLYRTDNLVRHAEALQNCGSATQAAVFLNEKMLNRLQCQINETVSVSGKMILTARLDNRVPDNAALIPAGFSETAMLGESFGKVFIEKI